MHRNLRYPVRRYREDLGSGSPVRCISHKKLDETLFKAEEDIPSVIVVIHQFRSENS